MIRHIKSLLVVLVIFFLLLEIYSFIGTVDSYAHTESPSPYTNLKDSP